MGNASFYIRNRGNIVAKGKVFREDKILHNRPMPENCHRVSIDEAIVPQQSLPYETTTAEGVLRKVGEALHSFVAWPDSWIILDDLHTEELADRPRQRSVEEFLRRWLRSYQNSLQVYGMTQLNYSLSSNVFIAEPNLNEVIIFEDDISDFVQLNELTGTMLICYCRFE